MLMTTVLIVEELLASFEFWTVESVENSKYLADLDEI